MTRPILATCLLTLSILACTLQTAPIGKKSVDFVTSPRLEHFDDGLVRAVKPIHLEGVKPLVRFEDLR